MVTSYPNPVERNMNLKWRNQVKVMLQSWGWFWSKYIETVL